MLEAEIVTLRNEIRRYLWTRDMYLHARDNIGTNNRRIRAKFRAITSQNGILRSPSFFRLREIEEKDADKKRIDETDIHAYNFSANNRL